MLLDTALWVVLRGGMEWEGMGGYWRADVGLGIFVGAMAEAGSPGSQDSPHSDDYGGNHGGGDRDNSSVREQDRFLPIANISRIMKKALPANAKIAKDAKETVQECVSEFISFITSEYPFFPLGFLSNFVHLLYLFIGCSIFQVFTHSKCGYLLPLSPIM